MAATSRPPGSRPNGSPGPLGPATAPGSSREAQNGEPAGPVLGAGAGQRARPAVRLAGDASACCVAERRGKAPRGSIEPLVPAGRAVYLGEQSLAGLEGGGI